MRDETIIVVSAIISVTVLEAINLVVTGLDSTLFSVVISTISGLVGYLFGYRTRKKKKK